MAARQDQGLQIALIVFIFLFVLVAVLWYLYFKSASELTQQVAKLQTDLRNEQGRSNTLTTENQSYRQMMGFDENEVPENVQKTFDGDMKRFGQTFDEGRRFYRDILEYIYEENEKIAAREVAAKEQVKDLNERLLAIEAEKEKQVQQFEARMKEAEEDAAKQRNSFAQDRTKLEAKQKDLLNELEKARAAYEARIAEGEAKVKDLETQLAKSERAKRNLLDERELASETFEAADGRISWVNQNGTVWINLGDADSVRRQITFSVFDTDQHDAAKSKKKGSIEVTRVLGDHLAEARITDDDARNPILTGDQLYSQVWERGKKLRFALTGFVDLDGDGQADLQLARDLIELNGGAVDAYLDANGKVVGEMTVGTRYLVLGDYPEAVGQVELRQGTDAMNKEASTLGVEVITLNEFLNQMGYRPEDQAVALGRGARSTDFPPEPVDADTAGAFRPRSPHRAPAPTPY